MTKSTQARIRSKPRKIGARRRGCAAPATLVEAGLNQDTPSLFEESRECVTETVEPGPVARRRDEPVEWQERENDTEGSVE
jgi:hypothetical protein